MIEQRYDLIYQPALARLAEVLDEGAKKYSSDWGWVNEDPADHLQHAFEHLKHVDGPSSSEDDLAHAFCRLFFALSLRLMHENGDFEQFSRRAHDEDLARESRIVLEDSRTSGSSELETDPPRV